MSRQSKSGNRKAFLDKRLEGARCLHQENYQDMLHRAAELREEFRQNAASIDSSVLTPTDRRKVALLQIFSEFETNLQSMKLLPSAEEMSVAQIMGAMYGGSNFVRDAQGVFRAFGLDIMSTTSKAVGGVIHFRNPSKTKMNRMKWLCRNLDDTVDEFAELRKIEKLVPALPESARDKALASEFRALGLKAIARVIDSIPPAP